MALLIGMDEAGYGPNYGPLVVGATVWEVPGNPRKVDLWRAFAGIVEQTAPVNDSHIQIADSKQVYNPAKGLDNLEIGVLRALALHRRCAGCADGDGKASVPFAALPASFRHLFGRVGVRPVEELDGEPWFAGADVPLPSAQEDSLGDRWHERCHEHGIRLRCLRADVVLTRRFNEHTRANNSKGQALSEISMRLLRHVWHECAADEHDAVLILADKHGGRNRYHEFLPAVFGENFIRCLCESTETSRYRVANAEVRFETKSERHMPVALASMVCKYLRELAMKLFNRYWADRQPGLKPTAGYPLDASRFRNDIAALQKQLGIEDEILWRAR
jgi:ribonuclease HII